MPLENDEEVKKGKDDDESEMEHEEDEEEDGKKGKTATEDGPDQGVRVLADTLLTVHGVMQAD